jgi:deoxyribodipyrimidine photo-lyase
LRIHDNTGLIAASKLCSLVIPIFIFDTRQIGSENKYRSMNAIQFMIATLQELEAEIKSVSGTLSLFHGISHEIVQTIIKKEKINAVFCNRDYTPFSQTRDSAIKNICAQQNCDFLSFGDLLLNEPESVLKTNKTPYTVYTPFYKKASIMPVAQPSPVVPHNFLAHSIAHESSSSIYKKVSGTINNQIAEHGGRSEALKTLKNIRAQTNYTISHNIVSIATSRLSAHLKFGTLSIRHVYWYITKELGSSSGIVRQLYWRDFFTHIAFHFPHVFGSAYRTKYHDLAWKNDTAEFKAWCNGMTGFPIVDAGMRELNATGYMHNRARLITGSFVTKDLHVDWRLSEQYFANQLVDYDPSLNNGNWQWVASTGCDAQPYFRIFNPWLQQKKFDPDCAYIKKWIPELKDVDNKTIHNWAHPKIPSINNYPKPIVDHSQEIIKTKLLYKRR